MLTSTKPAMPASRRCEMAEGTRRHDQELIKILQRGKALEGYSILERAWHGSR